MRFVLTWEEFRMVELLFIHMKENAFKKDRGAVKGENYEVSWNEQLIMIELPIQVLEKILLTLEGLPDV